MIEMCRVVDTVLIDQIPRYSCTRGWTDNGEPPCIAFGGLRVDGSAIG